ncbi:MAG: xanthine dehydrogenase family protein molybdopterin-binding subunit [Deltaproteobacteria bacterium]|nr:xanthine dehydrogenase family protein molybdopterin-binding subunit [Deltaproteobacteria bacterium]
MADLAGVNGQREKFRVVGMPNLPGRLSYAMAAGIAKYGADYIVPDMLHAKFLRSPYANARIESIDTARARKIPGVIDILTFEDEDIKNLLEQGEMMSGPLKSILTNRADQEGAEVGAIVIAESEDICDKALRQLDIKWDILPHVVDILEGRRADSPVIRPPAPKSQDTAGPFGMGGGNNPPKKGNVSYSNVNAGDVEAGFKEADHIIEYDLNMPAFSGHIPNPIGSVAWWFQNTYHGEGLNIHVEGVGSPNDPGTIANMYKVPPEKVFQECMLIGGKYCDWGLRKSQLITPLLAKRAGRPVRCVNSRYDQYDFNLNQRFMHIKIGFKKSGLITAIDDFSIADSGVEGSSIFGTTMDQNYGPYFTTRCQNVKQNMDIVDSNRGKMYLSGQHNPMNWDSITLAIHLIAEKLGKDPVEIARINLHGPESQTDPNPVPSFEACIAAAKKMMDWKWHNTGGKRLKDGRMHGASFRYQQCPRHSGMIFNCKLELKNGVVHLDSKGPVVGNYIMEANMMVVAEELGLNYEDIRGRLDSHETYKPWGGGSDGTTASGWALKECANILKKQILEKAVEEANTPSPQGGVMGSKTKPAASPFKGMKPEELDMVDGKIVVKNNPGIGVPLKEAVRSNLFATYSGRPPLSLWNERGKKLDTMNVAMCEVAVDAETGEVEIIRFGVVADTGKIMRRTSLESQIEQVMFFSEGCQLYEDYIYDSKTGVKLSANMFEYKKPTILDHAPVAMELLETRAGNAAYGSNGISHSLANTHLVIAAIYNAIGKWVDPPATPDKVLKALGKA